MAENEIRGLAQERKDYRDYADSDPMAGLIGAGNAAERQIKQLRKIRLHVVKQGLPGYQTEVREINDRVGQVMKGLNQEVARAKREKAEQ